MSTQTAEVPADELLKVKEAARRLGVSRSKLYELLDREGGIPSVRIDSCRRIDPTDLEAFIERNRSASPLD